MSSDALAPYDDERTSFSSLVESMTELEPEPPDSGSDKLPLSIGTFADDDDDDADLTSNTAHPTMSDQQILEWQQNIPAETTLPAALHIHTAQATTQLQAEVPVHLQAPRTHQNHVINCWIGLSVGWPQTDVSFGRFGMVHWSHIPYISIIPQYTLPQTFQYSRAPLGLLNGVSECDTVEPGRGSVLFYPDSLSPLPSL